MVPASLGTKLRHVLDLELLPVVAPDEAGPGLKSWDPVSSEAFKFLGKSLWLL